MAGMNSSNKALKEAEELDQVAGNVKDEIGERVAAVWETELLYGPVLVSSLRTATRPCLQGPSQI